MPTSPIVLSPEGKSAGLTALSTPETTSPPAERDANEHAPAWARYANPLIDGDFFHFITNWNANGSVTTGCRGRWAASEASVSLASPAHADRCEACERFRIELKQTERGLRELAAAPVVILQRHWLAEYEA